MMRLTYLGPLDRWHAGSSDGHLTVCGIRCLDPIGVITISAAYMKCVTCLRAMGSLARSGVVKTGEVIHVGEPVADVSLRGGVVSKLRETLVTRCRGQGGTDNFAAEPGIFVNCLGCLALKGSP